MRHGEDIRMGIRWIIGRPVETLLLVFGISLGIGATAAGVALAGRTSAEARRILASTEYREIVVTARQSASEMDRPAIVQTSTAFVFLTTGDMAAREDAQDVQYAYVANPTGFRFGAVDFPGGFEGAPPGEGGAAAPPPGEGQPGGAMMFFREGAGPGDQPAAGQPAAGQPAAGQPAAGQPAAGQPAAGQPAAGQPAAGQQAAGQPAAGQQAAGRRAAVLQATGQQATGQQATGQQATGQQTAAQQQRQQQRQRQIVQPPEGPQPVIEEARGYEVSPEFFTAWDMRAEQGSLFTLADIQKREPVIVLGSKIAATLYEDGQSMGRQVLSRNQLYRIIGVLEPTGTEHDQMIFTPVEMPELTGMDAFARFRGFNTNLHFTVADYTKLERAKAQLESYFDQKFGAGSAVITIPRYQAEATRDRNARLVTVILFLALAALVIAAANVTNILFARALRKRRAVGILKALGATSRGVFQLFFLEAALIGTAGAAVGAGLSVLMSKLMQDTMGFGSIYVSLLAAGIVGAAALVTALDIFPAMQAARVPAAEAIRYE